MHQCAYNFGNNLTETFEGQFCAIANTYNSVLLQQVNILKKGFLNKIAEKKYMFLFIAITYISPHDFVNTDLS